MRRAMSENWDLHLHPPQPNEIGNMAPSQREDLRSLAFSLFRGDQKAKVKEDNPQFSSSEVSLQLYRSWVETCSFVRRMYVVKAGKEKQNQPRGRHGDKDKKKNGAEELSSSEETPPYPLPLPGGDAPEVLFGGRYRLNFHVGSGSFGDVYFCVDCSNDEVIRTCEMIPAPVWCRQGFPRSTDVAIKLEKRKVGMSQLLHEKYIYKALEGGEGIPRVHWFGKDPDRDRNMMVMDFVGPSLEGLFNFCKRRFSLKTVLMIAPAMISRLEYIHGKGIIHRDIKPDNFVMGPEHTYDNMSLIDYGMAKWYRKSHTGKHVGYRANRHSYGTPRYASISALLGMEQSRRDDLEAVGYVLVYFLRGKLPWQDVKDSNLRRQQEMRTEMKRLMPAETLCEGYPIEFAHYLNYCWNLDFEEAPDYEYLRQMFTDLFTRLGYSDDRQYDWNVALQKELQTASQGPAESEAAAVVTEAELVHETGAKLKLL